MYGADRRRKHLFSSIDGHAAKQAAIAAACKEAEALREQQLLSTEVDALVAYFVARHEVEVPTLLLDSMVGTQHERPYKTRDMWENRVITVSGEAYDFQLPFSGSAVIFDMRPRTFDMNPPVAEVVGQALRFTVADRSLSAEAVKQRVDELVRSIESYLGWHRELWAGYSDHLASAVRSAIEGRKAKVMQTKGTAAALAGLGIKIAEKAGDSRTFVAPAVKQKVQPQLPAMRPSVPPEPTLNGETYGKILGLVRGAGRSIEQSSSRTRALDEETLRDMFLVPLNAHFGTATGEAFNVAGKTDILIRHETGNLFVAEFKIWGGDKHFLATIDQLLGYLSWRDTKAAIIVFNRNAGFSGVVAKMRELAKTHPCFVKVLERLDETSDSYSFSLPQDKNRQVTIALMAFDLGVRA